MRSRLRMVGAKITISDTTTLSVGGQATTRKKAAAAFRRSCRLTHLRLLQAYKDQGRASFSTTKHPASNQWITTGRYLSFAEYRFAIKARQNLLPTRTVQKRFHPVITSTRCRKCHQHPETLSHLVNHCPTCG